MKSDRLANTMNAVPALVGVILHLLAVIREHPQFWTCVPTVMDSDYVLPRCVPALLCSGGAKDGSTEVAGCRSLAPHIRCPLLLHTPSALHPDLSFPCSALGPLLEHFDLNWTLSPPGRSLLSGPRALQLHPK